MRDSCAVCCIPRLEALAYGANAVQAKPILVWPVVRPSPRSEISAKMRPRKFCGMRCLSSPSLPCGLQVRQFGFPYCILSICFEAFQETGRQLSRGASDNFTRSKREGAIFCRVWPLWLTRRSRSYNTTTTTTLYGIVACYGRYSLQHPLVSNY